VRYPSADIAVATTAPLLLAILFIKCNPDTGFRANLFISGTLYVTTIHHLNYTDQTFHDDKFVIQPLHASMVAMLVHIVEGYQKGMFFYAMLFYRNVMAIGEMLCIIHKCDW
jgi:hypothetical protein